MNDKGKYGLDTAYFKSLTDSTLVIQYQYNNTLVPFGYSSGNYTIKKLTSNTMIISGGAFLPEGWVGEMISLSR